MPRCKNCKEKFEAVHFNQSTVLKASAVKSGLIKPKHKTGRKKRND